tara:strand:- start:6889 stop:7707 length:819 start_codon:yes stop_codon:yes gene_type:complete
MDIVKDKNIQSSEKLYTKKDIIDLINRSTQSNLLRVHGTVDQIMSGLDHRIPPPLSVHGNTMLDINSSSFNNFIYKNLDIWSIFNTSNMKSLTKNITKISEDCHLYGNYSQDENGMNKMKGDLFEIFAEIFFKLSSSDNRVGITNYIPVKDIEDNGVDGVGTAMNKLPATVQVKFRSNPVNTLTISDLKNFQGLSYKKYNVPVSANQNLIIFTNCSGIHWNTETKVLENSTVTYGSFKEDSNFNLSTLLNNNFSFWKNVKDIVKYNTDKILK